MSTQELKAAYEAAEAEAHAIQAEKDAALDALRAEYGDRQRTANQAAADAQKAYNDAQALDALMDRPDGEDVARRLGLLE